MDGSIAMLCVRLRATCMRRARNPSGSSTRTYAELEFGVTVSENSTRERRNLASLVEDIPVVPFDAGAANAYGPIREATRDRKKDQLDKLIAAHAVSLGVALVTNNERDFVAYPGLKIENWLNG